MRILKALLRSYRNERKEGILLIRTALIKGQGEGCVEEVRGAGTHRGPDDGRAPQRSPFYPNLQDFLDFPLISKVT